jgi:hypothetical protein
MPFLTVGFFIGLGQAMLVGAVVGAVIGGITAAITGGDIGKGILFGTIGGAITGALTFGVGEVFTAMGTSNTALSTASEGIGTANTLGDGARAIGAGEMTSSATRSALLTTTAETATDSGGSSWMGKLWTNLGDSFSGPATAGTQFGAQALGAGIKGFGEVYMGNKTLTANEKARKEGYIENRKDATTAFERAMALQNNAGDIAAASGGGSDNFLDREDRMAIDTNAAEEARKTQLANTGMEIQGQKDINAEEYNQNTLARERMIATAGALKGASERVSSRPTGEENDEGVDTGVIPQVTYKPPEQQYA